MHDELKLSPEELAALRAASQATIISTSLFDACLCGKLLDIAVYSRKWFSGRYRGGIVVSAGVNYTDILCADCRKEFEGWPRIVCLGCKSLMGFYKPGRQATGFVFERGRHYHIRQCPKCNPKIQSTPVLEHDEFCAATGFKVDPSLDLLQEIGQKVLQGEAAAARLKEEYESSIKTI